MQGPALAHLQDTTQVSDSITLGVGHYHFFVSSSFNAAWSSIDSPNSFFSLRFLLFQRAQPLGIRDVHAPYLAFQLYSVA